MRTIAYSIVCEDAAHYFFVKRLLEICSFNGLAFSINDACYYQYRCTTKSEVLNRYVNISNQAFRKFNTLDLLIVVVDNDKEPPKQFNEDHKDLSKPIYKEIKDKVLIAIPVRCIEHWLRYLQWKNENPKSTKNESLEEEKSRDSKIKLYGSKKPSNGRTEAVINELLKSEDITWLISRSESFNHFYIELDTFSSH